MSRLDARIPPPLVMLLAAGLGWGLSQACPGITLSAWTGDRALAIACASIGTGLDAVAGVHFLRRRTTINPLRPQASTQLVTDGLHRFSRNPMYLGQALILLGFALWQHHSAAFLALPLYLGWVNRFQIVPEERALRAKFGVAYIDYCQRVRRWL